MNNYILFLISVECIYELTSLISVEFLYELTSLISVEFLYELTNVPYTGHVIEYEGYLESSQDQLI